MINTMRSEWIKVRTVNVHWILAIIAVGFPLLVTVLVAIFGDVSSGFVSSDLSSLIAGLAVVSAMLLGAMAAISLTSEFAHSTIRPTFAATPGRVRVMAAKLAVNTVIVATLTIVIVAVCWLVPSLILSGRGSSVSLGDDGVMGTLVSVCAHSVVVSWFAFGLALLIRNSPGTVTVFLLWPLLIENLIGLLFTLLGWDGATRWLPYAASITATVDDGGSDMLGRPWGPLYFAAVSLVIIALGTWANERRDA